MAGEFNLLTEALREKVYAYDAKKGYKEANKKLYRKLKRDKANHSQGEFVMRLSDIAIMLNTNAYWKTTKWLNRKNAQHDMRGLHTTNGESMLWLADQMKRTDMPISISINKGGFAHLDDGYHRFAAANHLKMDTLKVIVYIAV